MELHLCCINLWKCVVHQVCHYLLTTQPTWRKTYLLSKAQNRGRSISPKLWYTWMGSIVLKNVPEPANNQKFNSLKLCDIYTSVNSVIIDLCNLLFSVKPSFEPMLSYFQTGPSKIDFVKFELKDNIFHSGKFTIKYHLDNSGLMC